MNTGVFITPAQETKKLLKTFESLIFLAFKESEPLSEKCFFPPKRIPAQFTTATGAAQARLTGMAGLRSRNAPTCGVFRRIHGFRPKKPLRRWLPKAPGSRNIIIKIKQAAFKAACFGNTGEFSLYLWRCAFVYLAFAM